MKPSSFLHVKAATASHAAFSGRLRQSASLAAAEGHHDGLGRIPSVTFDPLQPRAGDAPADDRFAGAGGCSSAQGIDDAAPKQEQTVMKQAAELLEEALREAGGSMEEHQGTNPFVRRATALKLAVERLEVALERVACIAARGRGEAALRPPETGRRSLRHRIRVARIEDLRRRCDTRRLQGALTAPGRASSAPRRSYGHGGRHVAGAQAHAVRAALGCAAFTPSRRHRAGSVASAEPVAAKKSGGGAFILLFVLVAAAAGGVVLFRDQLFGDGALLHRMSTTLVTGTHRGHGSRRVGTPPATATSAPTASAQRPTESSGGAPARRRASASTAPYGQRLRERNVVAPRGFHGDSAAHRDPGADGHRTTDRNRGGDRDCDGGSDGDGHGRPHRDGDCNRHGDRGTEAEARAGAGRRQPVLRGLRASAAA